MGLRRGCVKEKAAELPKLFPFEYHLDQAGHPLFYLDPHVHCRECLNDYACNFSDKTCELCATIKPWSAKMLRKSLKLNKGKHKKGSSSPGEEGQNGSVGTSLPSGGSQKQVVGTFPPGESQRNPKHRILVRSIKHLRLPNLIAQCPMSAHRVLTQRYLADFLGMVP